MKNSILNLLIIALVSFTYTTNAQINFGNNYNQPTINTGANVNTGFKTLIPPLMWQIAICDGHRTSCNYDELRMIPTTNIVSVPRLFYLSVMGDGVPFQNVKVYAMGSGNTRYELPNYWVTAPYQHDVIEKLPG